MIEGRPPERTGRRTGKPGTPKTLNFFNPAVKKSLIGPRHGPFDALCLLRARPIRLASLAQGWTGVMAFKPPR